jgi:hypothetical protein
VRQHRPNKPGAPQTIGRYVSGTLPTSNKARLRQLQTYALAAAKVPVRSHCGDPEGRGPSCRAAMRESLPPESPQNNVNEHRRSLPGYDLDFEVEGAEIVVNAGPSRHAVSLGANVIGAGNVWIAATLRHSASRIWRTATGHERWLGPMSGFWKENGSRKVRIGSDQDNARAKLNVRSRRSETRSCHSAFSAKVGVRIAEDGVLRKEC